MVSARGLDRSKLTDSERCTASTRSGPRCQNPRLPGITVCRSHGGLLPNNKRKVTEARVLTGLSKMVQPIAPDDWEANPINSFDVEFRRTVAAIRYYDEKIASLKSEEDLVWGVTERVTKTATEFPGFDETEASQLNVYEVARRWERQHLTDLHKLWITAKLDVRKLEIEQRYVEHLDIAIVAIISALGKDPRDVEIRNIVRTELARLGPPGRQELGA